jgi:hypothetical protein
MRSGTTRVGVPRSRCDASFLVVSCDEAAITWDPRRSLTPAHIGTYGLSGS